jgi:hypothetical protein
VLTSRCDCVKVGRTLDAPSEGTTPTVNDEIAQACGSTGCCLLRPVDGHVEEFEMGTGERVYADRASPM